MKRVMTRDISFPVTSRHVMALLSVIAFGAGLVIMCRPEAHDRPAYYDGDGDDVGIAEERQTLTVDTATVQTVVQLAPLFPPHREVAQDSGAGVHGSASRILRSRAPPA